MTVKGRIRSQLFELWSGRLSFQVHHRLSNMVYAKLTTALNMQVVDNRVRVQLMRQVQEDRKLVDFNA